MKDVIKITSDAFFRYVWPLFPLMCPPYLLMYAYLRFGYKHSEGDRTLELGIGKVPYYKIYNKGDFVGVDSIHGNAKTNRTLSKIFRKNGHDHIEEHVVCVYKNLPFRTGIFDNVFSVWGCEGDSYEEVVEKNFREIGRVMKKVGHYKGFSAFGVRKHEPIFED
ncbi:MAG: hypothetical protein V1944_00900 [Candidatus Aenigmatarchaeota archaeon]